MEFYHDILEIVEVFVKGLLWKNMMVKMAVRMEVKRMVVSKFLFHHSLHYLLESSPHIILLIFKIYLLLEDWSSHLATLCFSPHRELSPFVSCQIMLSWKPLHLLTYFQALLHLKYLLKLQLQLEVEFVVYFLESHIFMIGGHIFFIFWPFWK